jgi:hypothetical protein
MDASSSSGRRRRRLRSRLTLPRPRRPKLPRPRRPKLPGDLWFRFRTRLRAIRYWIREKGQILWRALQRTVDRIVFWWSRRSQTTKTRVYAVAGVALLYLVVKFISIPGIPCQVSAAKECAPPNGTIAYVPENAGLYAHVTVNGDSHQWELAQDLRERLPDLTTLIGQSTSTLSVPAGKPINVGADILPWAKDDLALVDVPGPKKKKTKTKTTTTRQAYIVGVGDDAKADQFLAGVAPAAKSKQAKQKGSPLTTYAGGFATARSGDQALFGSEAAVRAALDAKSGKVPRLEDSDRDAARDALPGVRLAEVYLSPAGVRRFLAGRQGGATQLDTFVDYGATTGMAASLRARDDGVEVNLTSELDPKLELRSPTVFADLPKFEPSLTDEAGTRALGYVGFGSLGPAVNTALATAGAGAQGLAGSLRALARNLQREAGVDPLKDLLPALGGQAALVAEPTGGVPFASLIVEGVDETKANQALARLQRPLVRSVGAGGPQVPRFQTQDVEGATVHSLQISPSVNLSYAVFNGKLVVSTQPEGIAQVRSSGDNLAGTDGYEDATGELPDRVSALVFLNLEEVLGLAQQAGLAEDPLYASLSEDISHLTSLGLAVRGSDDELRSELFLATHD